MGGQLLLRALAEKAMSPDAAVLIAPMLGMNSGPLPAAWCARISRLMCVLGDPARMAWNNEEKPGVSPSLRQALLTHSLERYRSEEHTSELQSLMRISYAVFCLKKKNK